MQRKISLNKFVPDSPSNYNLRKRNYFGRDLSTSLKQKSSDKVNSFKNTQRDKASISSYKIMPTLKTIQQKKPGQKLGEKIDKEGSNNKKSFDFQNFRITSAVSKLFESIQQSVQQRNDPKFTFSKQNCKKIVEEVKKGGHNAEFFRVKMQSFINTYLDLVESSTIRQVSLIQLLNKINQENIEQNTLTLKYPQINRAFYRAHNLFHAYKRKYLKYENMINSFMEENKKKQNEQSEGSFFGLFYKKSDKNFKKTDKKTSQSFCENYQHNNNYLNTIDKLKQELLIMLERNQNLKLNIEKYKEILKENQVELKYKLTYLQQALIQKFKEEQKAKNFQLLKELEFITKQKNKYHHQKQKLKQQNKQLENENKNLQNKMQTALRVISIYQQSKKNKPEKTQRKKKNQMKYENMFQGQILRKDLENKTKLIELIQLHTKKQILDTNLLYALDLKNPTNIHEYIDGHQHFLVLIKMKNGHLLGAFSQDRFQQRKQYTQSFGFLFSLTNKKVFTINRQNKESKVLTYDQNWVIFGNSELRMQSNSDVIFSNLGIANRYMGKKGDSYMQLLGTNAGEKYGDAKSYEFYKISFLQ